MDPLRGQEAFWLAERTPFADEISSVVKEFAHAQGLPAPVCYYKNLPVWIVHESLRGGSRARQVQVIVHRDLYQDCLSFVPSVGLCLDEERLLVPKHCKARSVWMSKVLTSRKFDHHKFMAQLIRAWRMATKLEPEPDDLLEISASDNTPNGLAVCY